MSTGTAALPRRALAPVRDGIAAGTLHLALLGAAGILWVIGVERTDVGRISSHGLLPALPASFYAALVVLGIGFAVAVSGPRARVFAPLYLVALVVVLHATTGLLYSEPRYAWTYKHLGVTDYIAHYGATNRALDIYQNWPGFFALAGALQRATGASMLAIAPWAEVFFELAYLAAVVFLLRALGTGRVVLIAAWIFELGNWLGQDYFAPQSFAYVLSIVLIALCVRCAPAPDAAAATRSWWLRPRGRAMPWLDPPGEGPLRPRTALIVGAVLFAGVVTSHQLSPVFCIFAVATFAVTTQRLPRWVPIAMVAAEALWVAASLPLISSKYSLVSFAPLERPKVAGANPAWALPGYASISDATRLSMAALFLLAAVGLARRRRRGLWDLPLVAMIAVPTATAAIQPYNGEGILRAYLFALPWLAFLAASACAPAGRRVLTIGAATLATLMLGVTGVIGSFGRELINRITPQDVWIEQWYERHAPPGAVAFYFGPNVPNRITYRYASTQVWPGSFSPSLLDYPFLLGHPLGLADVPGLVRLLDSFQGTAAYVMVTPSEVAYDQAVGAIPPGSAASFEAALAASGDFRLVAQDGAALLYELEAPTAATAAAGQGLGGGARNAGAVGSATSGRGSRKVRGRT